MKFIATFLTLFIVWILLNGYVLTELVAGAIVAMVLSVVLSKHTNLTLKGNIFVVIIKFVFIYIPVFIIKLVQSNLDIARRVLSPKIPLNPGIVKVETELQGDIEKLVLANSITLTPGTLTVDVDGDLYVHTVEVKGRDEVENKSHISSTFEKILKGMSK